MPDHIHMILLFDNESPINGRIISAPTYQQKGKTDLSNVIGQFKRYVSKKAGFPVWQKSFFDRIIRNEPEYQKVWKYIDENPLKWDEDKYNTLTKL